jgi:hypothetical protein
MLAIFVPMASSLKPLAVGVVQALLVEGLSKFVFDQVLGLAKAEALFLVDPVDVMPAQPVVETRRTPKRCRESATDQAAMSSARSAIFLAKRRTWLRPPEP